MLIDRPKYIINIHTSSSQCDPTSSSREKTIDSVKTELTNAVTIGTSSTLTLTDITKTTTMNCYAVYDYTATEGTGGLTQIKGSAVLSTDTNKATVLAVTGKFYHDSFNILEI